MSKTLLASGLRFATRPIQGRLTASRLSGATMLLALALGLVLGCKKSAPAPSGGSATSPMQAVAQLNQAFSPPPTPEVQHSLDAVQFAVRYANYPAALSELDKLANVQGLTDAQKKTVSEVNAKLKQLQPNSDAPASAAQ